MNFKQVADQADAYALRKYFSSHSYEETKAVIDDLTAQEPTHGEDIQHSPLDIADMVFHVFNLSSLIHHVDKLPILSKHYPLAAAMLENTSVENIEAALRDGLTNWLVGSVGIGNIPISIEHMIPFFEIRTLVMRLEMEGGASC